IVANTLGDLTKPENRYEHHGFVPQPNTVALRHYGSVTQQPGLVHVTSGLAPLGGSRRGDDVMMTDALSFDLRVYDPGAP
ncbi:unnamed protein product, partial [Ectocarpus sp. 4 AP-2014]